MCCRARPCRWWRAYFTSGSSALYLFAYSAFYFYSKLDITKTVPMLMYFGYMGMVSLGFFCLTGEWEGGRGQGSQGAAGCKSLPWGSACLP